VSVGRIDATLVDRRYSSWVKREFDPGTLELMDRPQPVSEELERDLRNLRQLNRWFGGYSLIEFFLRRWVRRGAKLRVLDLATGSADIPRLIADYAGQVGSEVQIDAIDQQPATLEIAKMLSTRYENIRFIETNILEHQPAEPYDLVLCTLALHHFSENDAICVLRQCRELSRKFVLVSDLRRGWLGTLGVYLLTATIFREPMTKYDARLSMARAFSSSELKNLAHRAGWKNFGHRSFKFARQAIWLE
jgi:2-polyprenyl-3-methyl-5-hydroxy-6-metoxy-1,4-benzoquinol methylase